MHVWDYIIPQWVRRTAGVVACYRADTLHHNTCIEEYTKQQKNRKEITQNEMHE